MFVHPSSHTFEAFKYKTLKELKTELNRVMIPLPINASTENLKKRIQSKHFIIPNRISIQPMEGFDAKPNGTPSELTFRRYNRYSKGGAGLIWFEATAISEDCRSNDHQLILSEENVKDFKQLTSLIRAQSDSTLESLDFKGECCLILQLNHSGRYTKKNGKKFPIRAYHNDELDNAISVKREDGVIISDEELKKIEEVWVEKAILAKEAGFDGVDIKACHGYLISELLSAHNRKDSEYGGTNYKNRSKLLLDIMTKLQNNFRKDSDFLITSRLGVYDGNPYPTGFGVKSIENEKFPASVDLGEPIDLINNLYDLNVKLLNISAGNPHYKPYITRPYDVPVKGGKFPKEHPLFSVYRIIYLTSVIKSLVPQDMIIVGSGYSYFRQFAGNLASGVIQNNMVDICGFGRMSFANPGFAKQIFLKNRIEKNKTCITCSKCSQFMREGKSTGCAVRDPEYKNRK
ncbi:MAG: flavin oxidoreductase/NADH oxidase [Candidatus Lokiarchaeota archaeon]|nr:flavin oxidoreductase/NADH oxidase [Candidatus Lokiarchaeota archaeon]